MNNLLLRRRALMGMGGNSILPSGYVECEYIEGTDSSNSINTGVIGTTSWLVDTYRPNKTGPNEIVIGRAGTGSAWLAAGADKKWSVGFSFMGNCETRTELLVEFYNKGVSVTDTNSGDKIVRETGGTNPSNAIQIFGYDDQYKYLGRIYAIKCTFGGSFEGIPAQRISDGVFGLYDIANNVFYGDSGYTGKIK